MDEIQTSKQQIDLDAVKQNPDIRRYLGIGDQYLEVMGTIQHDVSHAVLVADLSREILQTLDYPPRDAEVAAIAGYLHDIGNMINRHDHGISGAIFSFYLLSEMGMDPNEMALVMSAIGNHEENTGGNSVNHVAAAVMLADKSCVHRSRVRKVDVASFSQRDRVNYAAKSSQLRVLAPKKSIILELQIDSQICSVVEYFEIFLAKMILCRRAALTLGCQFELLINGTRLL